MSSMPSWLLQFELLSGRAWCSSPVCFPDASARPSPPSPVPECPSEPQSCSNFYVRQRYFQRCPTTKNNIHNNMFKMHADSQIHTHSQPIHSPRGCAFPLPLREGVRSRSCHRNRGTNRSGVSLSRSLGPPNRYRKK